LEKKSDQSNKFKPLIAVIFNIKKDSLFVLFENRNAWFKNKER